MVKLNFNAFGYRYQSGIEVLIKSYASACQALEDEITQAAENAWAHQQGQKQGEPFVGQIDEGGIVIWDQQDVLNFQHEVAQDALRSLRRAFAITIYHQWERGARAWTNAKESTKHDRLVKAVENLGLTIHPNLHILRMVANLLKHDNDYWGKQIVTAAPSLIGGTTINLPNMTDWYEAVVISEQWMTDFFNAVAASGPTMKTIFP